MEDNFYKDLNDMTDMAYQIAKKLNNHFIGCIGEITKFSRDMNIILELEGNKLTEKQWIELENMISQFRQIFNDYLKENKLKGE